nr:hypothetical protein GCM10020093_066400 [Planobispora longispora]
MLFREFDPIGAFSSVSVVVALLLVFTLLITDFFDTMGTIVGVGGQAGLVKEDGTLPRTREILLVDSIGAAAAAPVRSPPTRRTSSRPPASARARAPAWPAWSPACCSCWRSSSHRWSASCPTRRRPRRWSWWAS